MEVADKDFQKFKAGDFMEVFNPKFNIWVLCEIVTNYGMVRTGDGFKWGYELQVIKEELDDKLREAYSIYEDSNWTITEDMSQKYWREAPPAVKVLYGGRKRRADSFS